MTYKLVKILHLLGLTLFLGSVFGHIASSIMGGEILPSPAFSAAREHIVFATGTLTIPGLLLVILSGIALGLLGGQVKRRPAWFLAHAGLGLAVAIIAATLVIPSGNAIIDLLPGLAQGDPVAKSAIAGQKMIEDISGAVNVLLSIAIIALGVAKPRLGR